MTDVFSLRAEASDVDPARLAAFLEAQGFKVAIVPESAVGSVDLLPSELAAAELTLRTLTTVNAPKADIDFVQNAIASLG